MSSLRVVLPDETFIFLTCDEHISAGEVLAGLEARDDVAGLNGYGLFIEEENGRFSCLSDSDAVFVDGKSSVYLRSTEDCVSQEEIVELMTIAARNESSDMLNTTLSAKQAQQKLLELSLVSSVREAAYELTRLQERGLVTVFNDDGGSYTFTYKEESANLPKPMLTTAQSMSFDFILMEMNTVELARQLTLIEHEIFLRIDADTQLSSRTAAQTSLPIKSWSGWSSQLSDWATTQIQRQPSKKKRLEACKYFLSVCSECLKLNNFSTLSTLVQAMDSTRLQDLEWHKMSKKLRNQKEEFQKLTSMKDDFFQMRKAVGACSPPLVPFLPLYIKDLSMVDSSSPTAAPLIAHIKTTFQAFQSAEYKFYRLHRFNRWLSPTGYVYHKPIDVSKQYTEQQLSSLNVPRDTKEILLTPAPERKKARSRSVSNKKKRRDVEVISNDEMCEVMDIADMTNFSLKIRIISAQGMWPLSDKTNVSSFCQISLGKRKKTTKVKPNTFDPEWNEEFLLEVEDPTVTLKLQLFHQEGTQAPTKDDLLGWCSLSLAELDLLNKPGYSHSSVNNLRTKCKPVNPSSKPAKPKIKTELTLIPKETASRKPSAVIAAKKKVNSPYSNRGNCTVDNCNCTGYKQTEGVIGGPCAQCKHTPNKHALVEQKQTFSVCPQCGYQPNVLGASESSIPQTPPRDIDEAKEAFKDGGIFTGATWEIDAQELELNKQLGEGSFAKVFRGEYRAQDVAVKVLKEKADKKALIEFEKEFQIMSALRSPHIVFFFGATVRPSLSMVLEFCHQGTLADVLARSEDYGWRRLLRHLRDTLKGLLCLHYWKPMIVHRDLKSLNLLVDEDDKVKVSDFGLSRFDAQENFATLKKLRGTYAYLAPEVYFESPYSPKSDIYSVGVIMWEMAYRVMNGEHQQPYAEYPELTFDFQIIIKSAKEDKRPTIPKDTPEPFANLIARCWDKSPDARPDTKELMSLVMELQKVYEAEPSVWDNVSHHSDTSEGESDDDTPDTV